MATENKREEKKYSIAKEPYKSAKRIKAKDKQVGKSLKKAHSEERREPSNTLNRTKQNNTEQQLSKKKWPHKRKRKKGNTLTRRRPKQVVKKISFLNKNFFLNSHLG